jgi:hypothetical protein
MGIYCYADFIQRNGQHLCSIKLLKHSQEELTTYRQDGDLPTESDGCTEENSTVDFSDDEGVCEYYYVEEPYSEKNEAIIVLIPQKAKRWNENHYKEFQDIFTWNLSKFKDFETYHSKYYDQDAWEFGDIAGYRDVIINEEDNQRAVWKSCRFKGFWLVNFEPLTYQAFVQKTIDPNLIPWYYYINILTEEKIRGRTKKEAFEMVLNFNVK